LTQEVIICVSFLHTSLDLELCKVLFQKNFEGKSLDLGLYDVCIKNLTSVSNGEEEEESFGVKKILKKKYKTNSDTAALRPATAPEELRSSSPFLSGGLFEERSENFSR